MEDFTINLYCHQCSNFSVYEISSIICSKAPVQRFSVRLKTYKASFLHDHSDISAFLIFTINFWLITLTEAEGCLTMRKKYSCTHGLSSASTLLLRRETLTFSDPIESDKLKKKKTSGKGLFILQRCMFRLSGSSAKGNLERHIYQNLNLSDIIASFLCEKQIRSLGD